MAECSLVGCICSRVHFGRVKFGMVQFGRVQFGMVHSGRCSPEGSVLRVQSRGCSLGRCSLGDEVWEGAFWQGAIWKCTFGRVHIWIVQIWVMQIWKGSFLQGCSFARVQVWKGAVWEEQFGKCNLGGCCLGGCSFWEDASFWEPVSGEYQFRESTSFWEGAVLGGWPFLAQAILAQVSSVLHTFTSSSAVAVNATQRMEFVPTVQRLDQDHSWESASVSSGPGWRSRPQ